jgi:sporulation protein YlmC with PRC-barrel domain
MKKWFTDILGSPIMVRRTPFRLGRMLEMVVDPDKGTLIALVTTGRQVIAPVDLGPYSYGRFLVRDPDILLEMDELIRLKTIPSGKRRLFGKKVVTKSGKKLGRVYDLAFEMETLSLIQILVCKRFLYIWDLEKRIIGFKQIHEITEEEIIVKDSCAKQSSRRTTRVKKTSPA